MEAATIGRIVRWARKRAGMTQQDLAQALGTPQSSIARIERGTVVPRTTTLMALLEVTGHQLEVEPIGLTGPTAPEVDRDAIRDRLRRDVPQRTWLALGRPAKSGPTYPMKIVRRLGGSGVPIVLIGELAEAAHGAPIRVGQVVEICHDRTESARKALDGALEVLGATTTNGSDYKTDAGRLHLVTETAAGDDFEMLRRTAVRMQVDTGIQVPVASLDDLIRIRRAGKTPDDRAAEALLRAIGILRQPRDGTSANRPMSGRP